MYISSPAHRPLNDVLAAAAVHSAMRGGRVSTNVGSFASCSFLIRSAPKYSFLICD